MEDLQEFKAALETAQEKGVALFGEIVKAEFSRLFGAIDMKLDSFEQSKVEPISAEEHEIEIMAAAIAHQERVKAETAEQEAAYAEAIKTADQTKIDLMVAQNKANVIAGVVDAISAEQVSENLDKGIAEMIAQKKADDELAVKIEAVKNGGSTLITTEEDLEKVIDELTTGGKDDGETDNDPESHNGGTPTEAGDVLIPDSEVDEAPALEIPAKGKK